VKRKDNAETQKALSKRREAGRDNLGTEEFKRERDLGI
jgi:hypothetical protein